MSLWNCAHCNGDDESSLWDPLEGGGTCDLLVCARHRVKVLPDVDYCIGHPIDVAEGREDRL